MAEQMTVSGPVEIGQTSKEHAAFELMKWIARHESGTDQEQGKREYWLKLYLQCVMAANNYALARVLTGE